MELSVLWVCAAFFLQVDCRISLGFWANALWSLFVVSLHKGGYLYEALELR